MLNLLIQLLVLGLAFVALPVGGVAYLALVLGRRLAGRVGMKVVAVCLTLGVIGLLGMFGATLRAYLASAGPLPADHLKGVVLSGAVAVQAAAGIGAAVFFGWAGQWYQAGRDRPSA